jgi:hypothetical protein
LDQLSLQSASALDVEGLVDGLVGDPHGLIIGEVDPQPVRDLLGTPRLAPAPVGSAAVPATDEAHVGTGHRRAVRLLDMPSQPVLDVVAQPVVRGQLRDLRSAGSPLGMPLSRGRPIPKFGGSCRRVPAKLARDRRRRPADAPGDLADPVLLGVQNRDLLALLE